MNEDRKSHDPGFVTGLEFGRRLFREYVNGEWTVENVENIYTHLLDQYEPAKKEVQS